MLKLGNITQSFNLFKIIFFVYVNYNLEKKTVFIKKSKPKRFFKKINTIFLITKNKGFLKMYIIKGSYNFKKFIKKKFLKDLLFKLKKKYVIFYLKKIIKTILLKMLLINKNKFNFYFFIKTKKVNIKNVVKKKFYKRKISNVLAWIFFVIIRKFFKKYNLNVNFFILFNKSHSNMNEKVKKLRRK